MKVFILIDTFYGHVFFDSRDHPGKTVEQMIQAPDCHNVWVDVDNFDPDFDIGYKVYVYDGVDCPLPIEYNSTSIEVVCNIMNDFEFVAIIKIIRDN